jgi:hypothetical protein
MPGSHDKLFIGGEWVSLSVIQSPGTCADRGPPIAGPASGR